MLSDVKHQ